MSPRRPSRKTPGERRLKRAPSGAAGGAASSRPDGALLAGLDRLVHEPARLAVLATLSFVERADATFLQQQCGLTWGNLSSHVTKLEEAGYVSVEKTFVERRPKTLLALTKAGRAALLAYREQMKPFVDGLPEG